MKKFSLLIFTVALVLFFSSAQFLPVQAGPPIGKMSDPCGINEFQTDFGCFPNDPVGFVGKFYAYGLGFVGMVSLMTLILGGYDIMTSRGDARRLNIGKSYIFYSIAGLLLAIFGFVFIQVVVKDILKIPGFK